MKSFLVRISDQGSNLETVVINGNDAEAASWCGQFNRLASGRGSNMIAAVQSFPAWVNPNPERILNILLGVPEEAVTDAVTAVKHTAS